MKYIDRVKPLAESYRPDVEKTLSKNQYVP
jgi:hypothetical protein